MKCGPHKSCAKFREFLQEEMVKFAQQSYWTVVPYQELVQALDAIGIRGELRVSPPGVIEQRERRP
jgi:hypothetical protein